MIARSLIDALRRGGHRVELASRFRSRDGSGDDRRQRRLHCIGGRLAERIIRRHRRTEPSARLDCWFTYHLYHKAPDWLGPPVCDALGLPYVVAEASVAGKQADGPWSFGFSGALRALQRADAVVALNSTDVDGVRPVIGDAVPLVQVRPFLDLDDFASVVGNRSRLRASLAHRYGLPDDETWLVTAAMMRTDNKLESYRVLARVVSQLGQRDWRLIVVGDGPARAEVERAFKAGRFSGAGGAWEAGGMGEAGGMLSEAGGARVVFTGRLPRPALAEVLGGCDLFLWPAIDEPLGMAMLEAQAAGLAVVAGAARGVADIVRDGVSGYLVDGSDDGAIAAKVGHLIDHPLERRRLGDAARQLVRREHSIGAAACELDRIVTDAVVRRRAMVAQL